MSENRFGLVDRIAARMDPSLVPAEMDLGPTNAEQARLANLEGHEKSTAYGWPNEQSHRRFLFLLEEVLRTQSGITVRQHSHVAPPFRAQPFAVDISNLALVENGTDRTIDILDPAGTTLASGGMPRSDLPYGTSPATTGLTSRVPDGWRGVITRVAVVMSVDDAFAAGTTVSYLEEQPITFDFFKNGEPVPGLIARVPTSAYSSGVIAAATSFYYYPMEFPNLLDAPIHLKTDDQITARATLLNTAQDLLDMRIYVRVGGYIYEVRKDENSIGGTVVD